MNKYDFNKPLIGLRGEKMGDDTLGQILADVLTQSTTGDSVKFYEIGVELMRNEPIKIDTTDKESIEKFLSSLTQLKNIAKAQILLILKNPIK